MTTIELIDTLQAVTGVAVTERPDGMLRITTDGHDDDGDPIPALDLDPTTVLRTRLGVGPLGIHAELAVGTPEPEVRQLVVASGDLVFEPAPQPHLFGTALPIVVNDAPPMVSWTETTRHLAQFDIAHEANLDRAAARLLLSAAFLSGAERAGIDVPPAMLDRLGDDLERYLEL
ncbi:MAG: hypothetical protein ACOYOQ_15625 [Microthrixaceae bacterium]